MLYRLNSLFNVSKGRALVVAILCFIAGLAVMIAALLAAPIFAVFSVMFWGYALIYGSVWFFKYQRDKRLALKSQAVTSQQQVAIQQPMTSPGSYRLFVPSPLDRQ